jgi:hypothetical protein
MTKKNLNHTNPLDEVFADDENRIDWERRRKNHQRAEDIIEDPIEQAEDDVEVLFVPEKKAKRGNKDHRRKRRQLIMDENSGQYVVKRRRKGNRQFGDWYEDDYD